MTDYEKVQIEVYSLDGKLVSSFERNTCAKLIPIDLSDLEQGIYSVALKVDNLSLKPLQVIKE